MRTQIPPKKPPPAFLTAACPVHHGLQSAPAETDHANELRRHSRKLGDPAGETPAVMLRAADEIDRLRAMHQALREENALLSYALTAHSNSSEALLAEQDESERLEQQLDELLDAAKRLQARGFFAPVSCADEETLKDMASMRAAIDQVTGNHDA